MPSSPRPDKAQSIIFRYSKKQIKRNLLYLDMLKTRQKKKAENSALFPLNSPLKPFQQLRKHQDPYIENNQCITSLFDFVSLLYHTEIHLSSIFWKFFKKILPYNNARLMQACDKKRTKHTQSLATYNIYILKKLLFLSVFYNIYIYKIVTELLQIVTKYICKYNIITIIIS